MFLPKGTDIILFLSPHFMARSLRFLTASQKPKGLSQFHFIPAIAGELKSKRLFWGDILFLLA